MKNFLPTLAIQIVASVATIAGSVVAFCLIGLFLVEDRADLFLIIGIAGPILLISWAYLWYRKVTWEEYLDAIWFISLPF